MAKKENLADMLQQQGISRRGFLKFCGAMASLMALPPGMAPAIAAALSQATRPSVIWLSFQECTGCTESLTRSHSPTVESLIFDAISLDYHHTLMAASGTAAEEAREHAMQEAYGKYLLIVDGSIPLKDDGVYSTIAGVTNLQMLQDVAKGAAAIIAVGSCAAFGGLPHANPNPTGAVPVSDIIKDKPVINDLLVLHVKHPRYGYRRITIKLREKGWFINFKRVYRLWCQEGLKIRKKQHKKLHIGCSENACNRKRPEYYNHIWSYDFLTERLENGRGLKLLFVIDEFTRECLSIAVNSKTTGLAVVAAAAEPAAQLLSQPLYLTLLFLCKLV